MVQWKKNSMESIQDKIDKENRRLNLKNDVIFDYWWHGLGKIEMTEEKNKTIKSALDEMEYLTGDVEIKRLVELRESSRIDKWFAMSYGKNRRKKKLPKKW